MAMKFSVSEVKAFQADQLEWYYAFVKKRIPLKQSVALVAGGRFHRLMESYLKFGNKAKALSEPDVVVDNALENPLIDQVKLSKELNTITTLFELWEDRIGFDNSLLVEEALEAPIPNAYMWQHVVCGRPDRVVRYEGKLWHVQHRSLGASVSIGTYLAAAERDLHELVYAYLISEKFGSTLAEYGGSCYNIVRKLSNKTLAERPLEAFVQEFIPLQVDQILAALDDLALLGDEMQSITSGQRRPISNREADKGKFGNSLSAYYDVKLGRTSLADDRLFRDAPDRYAELVSTASESE